MKNTDVEVGDVWKGESDTAFITHIDSDTIYFHSVHDKEGCGFPRRMHSLGFKYFHGGFYKYDTLLKKNCWDMN